MIKASDCQTSYETNMNETVFMNDDETSHKATFANLLDKQSQANTKQGAAWAAWARV